MSIPKLLWHQPLLSVTPETTAFDAVQIMREKEIGALAVLADDGKLAGIFSERDLMMKITAFDRSPRDVLVRELMTTNVTVASPEDTVRQTVKLMFEKNIRHLPMVDENGFPVAMLSFRDLYAYCIQAAEHENNVLSSLVLVDGPGG